MKQYLGNKLKYVGYRVPFLHLGRPKYPYKISPAQLGFLTDSIDRTKFQGSIIEVGVAKGDTSVFLLEHLRSVEDDRAVILVDRFAGFTKNSIRYETQYRKKKAGGVKPILS